MRRRIVLGTLAVGALAPRRAFAATTCTAVTSGGSGTDATSFNTASVSLAASRLILAGVTSRNAAATTPAIPTMSGHGQTWDQVSTLTYSSALQRTTVFRCASGAGSGPAALTFDFGGETQDIAGWFIVSIDGAVMTSNGADGIRNVNTNSGTGTAISVTMGAFADAGNATFLTSGYSASTASTPDSGGGWSEIVDVGGFAARVVVDYLDANDTSPTNTANTSNNWGAIGIEIIIPGAPVGGASSDGMLLLGVGP